MTSQNTIASVSVDLDGVDCYWRIHALPSPAPEDSRHVILRRCLPRFADLFARAGIKATFFVVGRDVLDDAEGKRLLAALARDGHELASHSFTHPYDLVRLASPAIADELDRAHAAIGGCATHGPVGFRSPGYETSGEVIDLLCARGYRYDSSAFPSVPYYLAKAAVMGAMRLVGRPSGSYLGSARILAAPAVPYRPAAGAPYRRGDRPIIELPMAVTPGLRLPVIGTSLITAPEWLRRRLVASALRRPFFNLELHGIDLADADEDQLPAALIARQPDLRRPLASKLRALERTLSEIRASGARVLTLAEVPAALAPPV